MDYPNPKHLVVEDIDLKGVVIGLMKHFIRPWPEKESEIQRWPVKVSVGGGVDSVLDQEYLETKIRESNLKNLGIVVDADNDFDSKWQRIRKFCRDGGATVPQHCPVGGLILDNVYEQRFGAWVMPDNKSPGMLENFCHGLVPNSATALSAYAQSCAKEARIRGAPYKVPHFDKAHIHTLLAWQDVPGQRLGIAITNMVLDPNAVSAKPFIAWFRALYGL